MTAAPERLPKRWGGIAYSLAALFAVFALLLLVRWEIVDSPPYFDFAIGIWREAEYLARTGFDYMSLRYECSHGLSPEGGPRSYMTSIVPSVLAFLFRAFPDSKTPIVVYHLAVILAASGAAVLLFRMLQPRVGAAIAVAASVAMTTTPIYCVQIDMVGFEIFLALAGLAWMWAVGKERFLLAAFLSFLAFLIKPPGIILTVSLAGYLGIRLGLELLLDRRWSWPLARALTVQIVVLAAAQALLWWGGSVDLQLAGRLSLAMALAWFPDVLVLVLISWGTILVLSLWTLRAAAAKGRPSNDAPVGITSNLLRSLQNSIRSQPMLWCAGFVVALLAVAISNVRFVPRYATMAVPFLYVILPIATLAVVHSRRLVLTGFALLTAVDLINWNGVLFPDRDWALEQFGGLPAEALAHEGSLMERSHEYLANHRENIEATKIAYDQAQGRPIVTSVPFNVYLAYPELGVVTTPANVYSVFPVGGEHISRIKESSDLAKDEPPEIICLRDTTTWFFALATMEIPLPTAPDIVLHQEGPEKFLTVYARDFRPAGGRDWQQWLRLAQSFPFYTALRLCAAYKHGGAADVYGEARRRLTGQSDDERLRSDPGPVASDLWILLSAAAARAGAADEAVKGLEEAGDVEVVADLHLQSISATEPEIALEQSLHAMLRGNRNMSHQLALQVASAESPFVRGLAGESARGFSQLKAGDTSGARSTFQRVLRNKKDFRPAQIGLAQASLQEGMLDEALNTLERILKEHPSSESAARLAALTYLSQGNTDAARQRLQAHLDKYPDSIKVKQCLDELEAQSIQSR